VAHHRRAHARACASSKHAAGDDGRALDDVNGRRCIAQPSSMRECRELSERAGAGGLHDIFVREIKHPL
jgi:hypothetical protein